MTEISKILQPRKRWTKEELDILETGTGELTTKELAALLGRTRQSILRKSQRLNLATFSAKGFVTASEMARRKGLAIRTCSDWLNKGQIASVGKVGRLWRVELPEGEVAPVWSGYQLDQNIREIAANRDGRSDCCINCEDPLTYSKQFCSQRCRGEFRTGLCLEKTGDERSISRYLPPYLRFGFQDFLASETSSFERTDQSATEQPTFPHIKLTARSVGQGQDIACYPGYVFPWNFFSDNHRRYIKKEFVDSKGVYLGPYGVGVGVTRVDIDLEHAIVLRRLWQRENLTVPRNYLSEGLNLNIEELVKNLNNSFVSAYHIVEKPTKAEKLRRRWGNESFSLEKREELTAN